MDEWVQSPIQSNLDINPQLFKIGQIAKQYKQTFKKYYFQEDNIIAKVLVINRDATIFHILAYCFTWYTYI